MKYNQKILAVIMMCLGIGIGVIGLLFKFMHWPGGKVMMLCAIPIMAAGAVLLIARLRKDQ